MIGVLRLIPRESQVHVLLDMRGNRAGRSQALEHGEVVGLPVYGRAQKTNTFLSGTDDEVLPRVPLLFSRVVVFLFVLILRPLDGSFGAVDEDFPSFGKGFEEILYASELTRGEDERLP